MSPVCSCEARGRVLGCWAVGGPAESCCRQQLRVSGHACSVSFPDLGVGGGGWLWVSLKWKNSKYVCLLFFPCDLQRRKEYLFRKKLLELRWTVHRERSRNSWPALADSFPPSDKAPVERAG